MRTASVATAKNRLSELLRQVRAGATIIITDRGVPVARLAPVGAARGVGPAALDLARRGLLALPNPAPAARRAGPRPRAARRASVVAMLLAERERSR